MTYERFEELLAKLEQPLEQMTDQDTLEIIVELCIELGSQMGVNEINAELIAQLYERNAALAEAVRSCTTCWYNGIVPDVYCRPVCQASGIPHSGWRFNHQFFHIKAQQRKETEQASASV